jgi:hypothetical protein
MPNYHPDAEFYCPVLLSAMLAIDDGALPGLGDAVAANAAEFASVKV